MNTENISGAAKQIAAKVEAHWAAFMNMNLENMSDICFWASEIDLYIKDKIEAIADRGIFSEEDMHFISAQNCAAGTQFIERMKNKVAEKIASEF